jgi:methylphosphotriester-DNA--protein-cysteine methyltransferase
MRPEAAGVLIGITPRHWVNRVVQLGEASDGLARAAVGPNVDSALAGLLAALKARASVAAAPDGFVRDAIAAMDEGVWAVEVIARRLGVSSRTLQRRFQAAAGLPPKAFARVRRFRMAMARSLERPAPDWGRVAAEHGFADQAHLAREVAALTGAPPAAAARRLSHIEHVDIRP